MTDREFDQPNLNDETTFNHNDLDWLAFCYVADELDEGMRAKFEARLENDELAQQAVADAVQQARVLYTSLDSTSTNDVKEPVVLAVPMDRNSIKRSGILLASSAAMLMLLAGWAWFSIPLSGNPDALAESDSDRLASAWVETLVVMSDDELDDFIEEESFDTESIDEESDNWMLVALTDIEDSEGLDRETN